MNRLTVSQFAEKTGYSSVAIYKNIAKGRLITAKAKMGGREEVTVIVISDDELAKWVKPKK